MKTITDEEFKILARIKEIGLHLFNIDMSIMSGKSKEEDVNKRQGLSLELDCIAAGLNVEK